MSWYYNSKKVSTKAATFKIAPYSHAVVKVIIILYRDQKMLKRPDPEWADVDKMLGFKPIPFLNKRKCFKIVPILMQKLSNGSVLFIF